MDVERRKTHRSSRHPNRLEMTQHRNKLYSNEEISDKVVEYRSRKWITDKQANALLKVLKEASTLQIDGQSTENELIHRIQRSLDKIKKRHDQSSNKKSHRCLDTTSTSVPTIITSGSKGKQNNEKRTFDKIKQRVDQNKSIYYSKQEVSNSSQANPVITFVSTSNNKIFLPESLSDHNQLISSNSESVEYSVSNLFVEMCFFARLGFLQPPCCLKCIHQLKIGSYQKSKFTYNSCRRYVVWRRDASMLFRPENMQENLMFVPCRSAQKLLRGEEVQGWKWYAGKKQCKKNNKISSQNQNVPTKDNSAIMNGFVSKLEWDGSTQKDNSMISSFR